MNSRRLPRIVHDRLAEVIRKTVVPRLCLGAELPSSRSLAPLLGVSHVTVRSLMLRELDVAGIKVAIRPVCGRVGGNNVLVVTRMPPPQMSP